MHYRTDQLRKELKCSSTGPIIWTTLTQIPLFVLGTTVLQHVGYLPEVLAAAPKEVFLTLPGQETLLIPLVIGAASIANYGMGSWGMVRNMAKQGGVEDPDIKEGEEKNREGKKFDKSIESQSMLTTFSVLAVMRGVLSMSLPGVSTQRASCVFHLPVFSMVDRSGILAHLNTAQYRRNIVLAVRRKTKNTQLG
jgi:hypothetical protein